MKGSPPPMRGKDSVTLYPDHVVRITPAYAGKSPHTIPADRLSVGSPPPMRGKAFQKQIPVHDTGITPAYAGKSAGRFCPLPPTGDHPRLCGEKFPGRALTVSTMGSPSPMRGKAGKIFGCVCPVGITPAYAGKSRFCMMQSTQCVDHPRLCGEKPVPDE